MWSEASSSLLGLELVIALAVQFFVLDKRNHSKSNLLVSIIDGAWRAVLSYAWFITVVSVPELVWTTEKDMKRGALDKIDQPGGLGWPGTMRLATGCQLLGECMPPLDQD